MQNNLSNEDALLEQHDEFMKQVSESGVPLWMLQMYGEEPKPLNNDNNQENRENPNNDSSTTPAL